MPSVSHKKLWKLLIDKGITKTRLRQISGVSKNTIAKLGHGESVTTDTLGKICDALKCDITDIAGMSHTGMNLPEDPRQNENEQDGEP